MAIVSPASGSSRKRCDDDSACAIPPHSLEPRIVSEIERQTGELALALQVKGLMNVQFAVKDGEVYLIEVNPRASRTVPFVAKAIGVPVAKIAARVMAGEKLSNLPGIERKPGYIAVKESVFPFAKFPEADPILGPEMKSTGEVMGTGLSFGEAYAKAQLASGVTLPTRGVCLISVRERDKPAAVTLARRLVAQGFEIVAGRPEHKQRRLHPPSQRPIG